MGLAFHYSGSFNPRASLQNMIAEVRDIAEIHHWKYHVFEEEFLCDNFGVATYDDKLYGICFTPPECETVFLTFLSNGRLSSPINLHVWSNPKNEDERDYLYMISVKTQYAGVTIHQILIQLFRHLNKHYFVDFSLSDEGYFWETSDVNALNAQFKRYNAIFDSVVSALENIPLAEGEDLDAYLLRLFETVKRNSSEK